MCFAEVGVGLGCTQGLSKPECLAVVIALTWTHNVFYKALLTSVVQSFGCAFVQDLLLVVAAN